MKLPDSAAREDAEETVRGTLDDAASPASRAPVGVVWLDISEQITGINPDARQLLNCSLPDAVGRDFWDLLPESVAEHHHGITRDVLAASDEHHFVVHNEFEGNWTEYAFTRHSAGFTVSLRDVSAAQDMERLLQESERRNHFIFAANPNAMWVFDAVSLRIISANEAAVQFYGIPRKVFLKLKMGALFPDGEGAALLSLIDLHKDDSSDQAVVEICKQKKMDGQLVLVELACGHIRWNEHKAILVTLADVTERHLADRALRRENAEMEEQLETAQAGLKKSTRDLEAFTYALSNDLQGPLHAANGFTAVLIDKYAAVLGDAGMHYVNRIQVAMRQLGRLVDDLRTLVQLPPPDELEPVDVPGICNLLIADLKRREPGRVVAMELEAGLPLTADRILVTKALTCLLDNAWKFTSTRAEGWIRIALLNGKSAGEVVLQVSDNGVGFDAAYTDTLFTAFKRLHSSADFPGHGLGLAIVKGVAERHGGRVWAETGPTGASFYMVFPQDIPPPAK